MKPFETFYFEGWSFDAKTLEASFSYSFDRNTRFTEKISFASAGFIQIKEIDSGVINTLLFHLSLALGISYYKLYPTKNLVVVNGSLNEDQQAFWKKFYLQGLGEFFYTNKLSPKGLINFVNGSEGISSPNKLFANKNEMIMVALGGGKDSLVSVELVKKLGMPFFVSTFGKDYPIHQQTAKKIGVPRLIMHRILDPKLFEMIDQGYYNGHIPITGIIAFVLTTAAYLYDYKYIVMSNEKSANEENTVMDGITINHQRSKSYEFEQDFSEYMKKYLSQDVKYFSLLRGMYEVKIAKLFAGYKQYFDIFSSCNDNFKIIETNKITSGRRCGKCPKCAFVYAVLRPFISDEETLAIFGHELYEDTSLEAIFRQLLDIQGIKPFECVGTPQEIMRAMASHYKALKDQNKPLPPILSMFEREIIEKHNIQQILQSEVELFRTKQIQNIPPLFASILS